MLQKVLKWKTSVRMVRRTKETCEGIFKPIAFQRWGLAINSPLTIKSKNNFSQLTLQDAVGSRKGRKKKRNTWNNCADLSFCPFHSLKKTLIDLSWAAFHVQVAGERHTQKKKKKEWQSTTTAMYWEIHFWKKRFSKMYAKFALHIYGVTVFSSSSGVLTNDSYFEMMKAFRPPQIRDFSALYGSGNFVCVFSRRAVWRHTARLANVTLGDHRALQNDVQFHSERMRAKSR